MHDLDVLQSGLRLESATGVIQAFRLAAERVKLQLSAESSVQVEVDLTGGCVLLVVPVN